jgi:hypothetical protein
VQIADFDQGFGGQGGAPDLKVGRMFEQREKFQNAVMPAQAGIQKPSILQTTSHWTPAFAGVTECYFNTL